MAPSTPPEDRSEGKPDTGQEALPLYLDKVLAGVSALSAGSGMQKTWHIGHAPDLDLVELSITFPDFDDGMADTDVLCEVDVTVIGLCQQLDAQDDSTIQETAGKVTGWTPVVGNGESYTSAGSPAPVLTTVGGKQYVQFDGVDDRMAEQNNDNSCVSRPGTGDFTAVAVYRARNDQAAGRGFIWGYGTDRRWFIRIAANGSDLEFNVDDDTTSVLLTANDVDFSNDDVYVVFAQKSATELRFYYGNGGALAESTASPVALPGGFGSLTQPTNAQIGDAALGTGQFLDGDVGELRMYDRVLAAAARQSVYDALVTKWAL